MSLLSPSFAGFAALAFAAYFASPARWRWRVLLIASYVFYWRLGGVYGLIAVSAVSAAVFLGALSAERLRLSGAGRAARRRPVAAALAVIIGMLIVIKYGWGVFFPGAGLLSVAGLSFYALQAAGYLVDVYTGKAAAERDPLKVALFLSFFPQLIQGPISRHGQVAKDLFAGHGWSWERARRGLQRIMWGCFAKLAVADRAAVIADTVFGGYERHGGAVIILALLAYSVQLYGDFSGGIDVAVGIAEIVGVKLPENFRQPFFAVSVADFWRRWHITLGAWLRDYLFYPIALSKPIGALGVWARKSLGARVGKILPATVATFAVYIVMGVWHGASWQGLVFGLLNGLIISSSQFAEPLIAKLRKRTGICGASGAGRAFAMLRTLGIMMFLRYFARAGSLGEALGMIGQTAFHPRVRELWNGALMGLGLDGAGYAALLAFALVMLGRDILAEKGTDPFERLNAAPAAAQAAALAAMLAVITVFGVYSGSAQSASFIYQQY